MVTFLILGVYCGLGYLIWMGIVRLARLYEDCVPEVAQEKLYHVAKNFPSLVIDLALSLLFWSGLGSLLLGAIFAPFGARGFLPFSGLGLVAVPLILILFVHFFWSSPARTKTPEPRGRSLRERPGATPKQTTPAPQGPRGRTIRTYRDIK